jgi:hypothetical protein
VGGVEGKEGARGRERRTRWSCCMGWRLHGLACACAQCIDHSHPSPFLCAQAYMPLDMRTKKTRAIRRRLSKEQVCVGSMSLVLSCSRGSFSTSGVGST